MYFHLDCKDKKSPKILSADRLESQYKAESLLPGNKENNYTLYITVHVSDKLKAVDYIHVCIKVQVSRYLVNIEREQNTVGKKTLNGMDKKA